MAPDLFPDIAREPPAAIARVALPVPLDRLFDYAVPDALRKQVEPGRRVRVPMESRHLVGVVVELREAGAASEHRLRAIEMVLDPAPVLDAAWLEILLEEARALCCPPGIALQTALPPGSSPTAVRGLRATPLGREALARGALREPARRLLARIAEDARPEAGLARGPGEREALDALLRDGLAAPTPLWRSPRARVPRVRTAALAEGFEAETARAALARAPSQHAILEKLIAAGGHADAAALATGPRGAATLRALAARGLVRLGERDAEATLEIALPEAPRDVTLTAEQARADGVIRAAVRERRPARFLLHGVTGSGKTEVYLRAVAETLAAGRQALVLVPEITLTHQIVARLRARFGDALAVLHSGLRPGQRLAQWERLSRGETPIAVGARSALFAPLADLGLVVLDEEHEAAYKNEEGFRYHARRLGALRARAAGAPLVLGSATPSLETRLAAERGQVERLVLSHRIGGRPLPAVRLVDLAEERGRLPRGRKLVLTTPLRRALRETLAEGGQSILFLNRRGFSTQIACFACGHVERCKHCDISLVFHTSNDALLCHYCDYRSAPPAECSACGSAENALLGIGTERLEEEVRAELPDARVARLDRDVAARRGATGEILAALRAGRIDVLVGTQMVAKGHDFPGVRLVGVVNADLGLQLPDFRAAERTFQLLAQVAGRAGRGGQPGRVVVQTHLPDHPALRALVNHDTERFFRLELEQRRALGYPPFGALARVVVSAPEEAPAREAAQQVAEAARGGGVEVLGPAPAPLSRLRGRHRMQILLKAAERAPLLAAARRAADAGEGLASPVRSQLDVDPVSML